MTNRNFSKERVCLRPSGSERWLHCTPSAAAEQEVEDVSSDFAREGSLAHALAAKALNGYLGRDTEAQDREIAELSAEFSTEEMAEYVESYVAYVTGEAAGADRLEIETKLILDRWIGSGSGTADAVIIKGETLHIVDLKYGKGVRVEAEDNPQMKIYALGALDLYDPFSEISKVRMTIFQPRIGNVSTAEIGFEELKEWGVEVLKPLAAVASRGLGARREGKWCKFCKVRATCTQRTLASLRKWLSNPDAESLSLADLGDLKPYMKDISEWVTSVNDHCLDLALKGSVIPGHKLVNGRSTRKISDPERAKTAFEEAGIEFDRVFRPLELKTLTALEKEIGKKRLAEILGDIIVRKEGAPTLVEESDRRRSLGRASEFDGIDLPSDA